MGRLRRALVTPVLKERPLSLRQGNGGAPRLRPRRGIVDRDLVVDVVNVDTREQPEPQSNALEAFKYLVFKDPNWDWHRFNVATDIERALQANNNLLNLTDPNLKRFFDRGGKLLRCHGWADP
jgi:hypothetical protein